MNFTPEITGPNHEGWYTAIARYGGEDIGSVTGRPQAEYPGSVYLSHASVDSMHQRKGIAIDLLCMLVDRIDQTEGVDYPVTARAATIPGRLLLDAFDRLRPERITRVD